MTIIAGVCKNPRDNQGPIFNESKAMTFASLKAMADLLGPHPLPILRTGDLLHRAFPTPTTTDFDFLDHFVETAVRAGWRAYLDCAYPPAWATGGKGAYVASVEGSSCQILAQWGVPRSQWAMAYEIAWRNAPRNDDDDWRDVMTLALTGLPGLTNTPEKIAWHFVKNYRAELGCAQAWNIPEAFGEQSHGGVHVWGEPKYVEQDKLSAPRPWLLSAAAMPHVDHGAMEYMGETLATRYGDVADMFGVSINEPDIALFYPLIRFDGVNGGDGGDTIRDRLIPEQINPFVTGLKAGFVRNATLEATPRWPQIIGPNVAYAGTRSRFAPINDLIDVDGNHLYADESQFPKSSYEHAAGYAQYAKVQELPWGCSEFDRASQLTEWLRGLLALRLDPAPLFAIFNVGERFIDGWGTGGTEPNDEGRAMSALLRAMDGRRRAVGK